MRTGTPEARLLPQNLLSVEGVASYFGVSPSTVRWLVFTKRLGAYKIGRRLRFSEADLISFLESNRKEEGGNGHL